MVDNLIWFGDSWPAGNSLRDRTDAFPIVVGNNLGIDSINYAVDGSSQSELIVQFNNWKQEHYNPDKKYILIACLTNDNRFYWKDDTAWFTVLPSGVHRENVKSFYKHTYNEDAINFYSNCCIGNLRYLCNELNVPLLFIRNFKNMEEDLRAQSLMDIGLLQVLLDDPTADWGIVKEKISMTATAHLFNIVAHPINSNVHPNVAGHKKIADIVANKLNEFIIQTKRGKL